MSLARTIKRIGEHPGYYIWRAMMQRCTKEWHKNYDRYGGRGIEVEEYLQNSRNFCEFWESLNIDTSNGDSMDRINKNGNYTRDNLRCTNKRTQTLNRNKLKNNTSGYVGVSFGKASNSWRWDIMVKGVRHYKLLFDTPEEAVIARNQYVKDNNLSEYYLQEVK